jgi:hypothetical protein
MPSKPQRGNLYSHAVPSRQIVVRVGVISVSPDRTTTFDLILCTGFYDFFVTNTAGLYKYNDGSIQLVTGPFPIAFHKKRNQQTFPVESTMSLKSKVVKAAVITPIVLIALMACAHMAMMAATPKPPASEFGYGPRATTSGEYRITIEDSVAFKTGKMLQSVIRVTSKEGKAVSGLQITVDGGMPQHGHGLPTKPRVTKDLGDGRYQVEGLKFNMGGWWELKFAFAGGASDSVVFNLEL